MNVLFICEDNSALSIMAESILNAEAPGRFQAYSAGCFPNGAFNDYAVEFLRTHELRVPRSRPLGLQQMRVADAARMDFIITLADAAADEALSAWPGEPFVAHWNVQDEAADPYQAVRDSFWTLVRRIKIFASLPHGKLSRRVLERRARTLEAGYH